MLGVYIAGRSGLTDGGVSVDVMRRLLVEEPLDVIRVALVGPLAPACVAFVARRVREHRLLRPITVFGHDKEPRRDRCALVCRKGRR